MFGSLREFRKFKQLSQEEFGRKIGLAEKWKNYPNWETGRSPCPSSIQDKIRKLGYDGPWPQEVAKTSPIVDLSHLLTREEFAEWRGYWKAGTEKLLTDLVDQARRISELEKQVSELLRNSK